MPQSRRGVGTIYYYCIEIMKNNLIILSAGSSSRMGSDKLLLNFRGKETFLSEILMQYDSVIQGDKVLVVHSVLYQSLTNYLDMLGRYSVKLAVNMNPGRGRLSSIQTGLMMLQTKGRCFIQDADHPWVSMVVLEGMGGIEFTDNDFIQPVWEGKSGHPVLIGRNIISAIQNNRDNKLTFRDILKNFRRIPYHTDWEGVCANINTPEDYKYYQEKLCRG